MGWLLCVRHDKSTMEPDTSLHSISSLHQAFPLCPQLRVRHDKSIVESQYVEDHSWLGILRQFESLPPQVGCKAMKKGRNNERNRGKKKGRKEETRKQGKEKGHCPHRDSN